MLSLVSKKNNRSNFFLTGLLLVISLIALVFFAMKINDAVAINRQSEARLKKLEKEFNELQALVAQKNERYNRLLSDEEFVKRIIKQKFGYTYPDEIVFKFKDGEVSEEENNPIK
ncbi:MAG: septum formation initiator family protein [Opitutales bacterium]